MILSDKEILELQKGKTLLISPFDESRLRGASYDVVLDDEVTLLCERAGIVDLANQDSVDQIYSVPYSLKGFVLKPSQYCLAALGEIVSLPDNVVARIMPRTRFTRLGLLVTSQFCNPSYRGRLRIGLLNASGNNIKLASNLLIAQLVFEKLESIPTEKRLYRNQTSAAYQDEDELFIGARTRTEMTEGSQRILDRLMANIAEGK